MNSACPSREELARIGTGLRGETCPPELAAHIEGCLACREILERSVQNGLESLAGPPAVLPRSDLVPRIDGFTIERELGRGAMGVVYLANMDTLRRQVALKLLAGGSRAGPRDREHWLREAKAVASVRHPNIVTLHELKEVDDWFLMVLEYIPGGTLADHLSEPMAPRDAARLMETIARAVHHIHQRASCFTSTSNHPTSCSMERSAPDGMRSSPRSPTLASPGRPSRARPPRVAPSPAAPRPTWHRSRSPRRAKI